MKERIVHTSSGWVMLAITLGLFAAGAFFFITGAQAQLLPRIGLGVLGVLAAIVSCSGFFTLEPNEARVLLLFGDYIGTSKDEGFRWTNPFYSKERVSLRLRNIDGDNLKVNDKSGNPIEISAIIVWKIDDTAKAMFDVDNCEHFVKLQSDSAVRALAGQYDYDHKEEENDEEITLRGGDPVNEALLRELQERVDKAGVTIVEARLNHLAYAPEIASAMLKRQQAQAIIAARRKIVDGAVSMVEMALKQLEAGKVVTLDDERKAAMVSNLLVVLCGETEAKPVINTGTLHA